METTRQQKIERLIQKELGDIFLHYAKHIPGTLISVSEVRISPDLSICHAYLSIFPNDRQAALMEQIKEETPAFRGALGNRVSQQLRIIPELNFHLDETIDKMAHIDELLKH